MVSVAVVVDACNHCIALRAICTGCEKVCFLSIVEQLLNAVFQQHPA